MRKFRASCIAWGFCLGLLRSCQIGHLPASDRQSLLQQHLTHRCRHLLTRFSLRRPTSLKTCAVVEALHEQRLIEGSSALQIAPTFTAACLCEEGARLQLAIPLCHVLRFRQYHCLVNLACCLMSLNQARHARSHLEQASDIRALDVLRFVV